MTFTLKLIHGYEFSGSVWFIPSLSYTISNKKIFGLSHHITRRHKNVAIKVIPELQNTKCDHSPENEREEKNKLTSGKLEIWTLIKEGERVYEWKFGHDYYLFMAWLLSFYGMYGMVTIFLWNGGYLSMSIMANFLFLSHTFLRHSDAILWISSLCYRSIGLSCSLSGDNLDSLEPRSPSFIYSENHVE